MVERACDLVYRLDARYRFTYSNAGYMIAGAILERFGARLEAFNVERPSLESVFLALTGREIRDRGADPGDRLLAFGRQGGEHTR
mgnify:CR=1 FL=1